MKKISLHFPEQDKATILFLLEYDDDEHRSGGRRRASPL